jgi:hypothetical protein
MTLPHLALALGAAGAGEPAARVGSGTIVGGWGYVWAAWGITWAMMIGYGVYLWVRRPGAHGKDEP